LIPLLDQNRDALADLCRQYHVAQLEIFGSAATGQFQVGTSDLDFVVEFQRMPNLNAADQYFGLLFGLEKLFDRRIDLVCATAMKNPYFIQSVNHTRKILYAA